MHAEGLDQGGDAEETALPEYGNVVFFEEDKPFLGRLFICNNTAERGKRANDHIGTVIKFGVIKKQICISCVGDNGLPD